MNIQKMAGLISTLAQLRKHTHWTRSQLETYQHQALMNLRDAAYQHSPFYQQFHRGCYDQPLHELPVLTKQVMMENFDDLVTDRDVRLRDVQRHGRQRRDNLFLERYRMTATLGSTGSPGIFLFNDREWEVVLASFARALQWAGTRIDLAHQRKVAVVASADPNHMSYQVGSTLQGSWVSTLCLSATESLDNIVARLNDFQPETLLAYPSMIRTLAVEQLEKRLHILPQSILTSFEMLTDDIHAVVETAWGKRLFNQYTAAETASIAAECQQHTGLHLYEDLMIVENVDEHYQPVPLGVYGDKILVTVLFNHTQPLIRYELDDQVRFSTASCACGCPFMLVNSIQGCAEETLHFPSAAAGQVTVHPNLFQQVMNDVSASAWQIVHKDDGLHVFLSDTQKITVAEDELVAILGKALARQWAIVPRIHVQQVETIPRAPNGKMLLVKSETTSIMI